MGIACVDVINMRVLGERRKEGPEAGDGVGKNAVVQLDLGTDGCEGALERRIVGHDGQVHVMETDG